MTDPFDIGRANFDHKPSNVKRAKPSAAPYSAYLDGLGSNAKYALWQEMERIRCREDYMSFIEYALGIDCLYTRESAVREYLTRIGNTTLDWLAHRWDTEEYKNTKGGTSTRLVQRVPRKMLVVVPRKTFKTSGVSEILPVFGSVHDPNLVCGVMSSSYEKLAIPIADNIRSHFAGQSSTSRLTQLYGEFKGDKWSGPALTIGQRTKALRDPTVSAYGVRQGAVGHHFDLFILDDPVTNEAMANDSDWLNRTWRAWVDLQATLNPNALVVVVMTRYHDADLVGRIIEHEIEPAVRDANDGHLPADYDRDEGWIKYAHLAGWDVQYHKAVEDLDTETPTYNFPGIWGEERVADVRKGSRASHEADTEEYSELFFWCQLQNTPQKRADNPIQEIHLEGALGVPDRWSITSAPRLGWVDLHCDFAFKDADAYTEQRGDFTVAHMVAKRDGFVWRINGYRGKPTQDLFADEMIRLAYWARNEWKSRIRFLSFDKLTGQGSGDRSTEMWIQNLFRAHPTLNMPAIMPIMRQGKNKTKSILATAWAWQEGWVRLCKEAPGNDQLVYQMGRIGYTRHDDDADAFADCFHPDMYKVAARVEGPDANDWDWRPAVPYGSPDDDWGKLIWPQQKSDW